VACTGIALTLCRLTYSVCVWDGHPLLSFCVAFPSMIIELPVGVILYIVGVPYKEVLNHCLLNEHFKTVRSTKQLATLCH